MNLLDGMNQCVDGENTGIWRYRDLLPQVSEQNQITMGEGNTPLVKSQKIARDLGVPELFFKLESTNPTGSYKDRIAAMGVSWALEHGKPACIGTSSGNAGASIAAYAARAGLTYHLLTIEHIVESKLTQIKAFGANIVRIKGFGESKRIGDRVFDFIQTHAAKKNWEVMITAFKYNPVAMEAVKTIAYEIYRGLGNALPDAVFVPVGGGGLFIGIWRGFTDIRTLRIETKAPQVVAVQSEGCANIVNAWIRKYDAPLNGDSTSQVSGLQVPNPPDGVEVLKVLNGGHGWGETIPDSVTWKWQERLALDEGILCEPAAAISVAGVERAVREGRLNPNSRVVCIITGAGYKDSDRLREMVASRRATDACDIDKLVI